jgi:WD40 repeat protein
MPIDVTCPHCGTKLKAPDTHAGKKAKCKKCRESFRVPGAPVADSVSESQMLSVAAMPIPDVPDAEEVPMAGAVEDIPQAEEIAALPSADPFDFAQPAAKPAFGAAKPKAEDKPKVEAKPKVEPKVEAKPKAETKPTAPASAPKPEPPKTSPKPAKTPEPEPLPIDDEPFAALPTDKTTPLAKKPRKPPEDIPEPAPVANAFDFGFTDETEPTTPKKKRFYEDDEEDEKPKSKKKKTDDEEKPKGKKNSKDDDDEDEEPAKPRYLRPEEKGSGMAKMLLLSTVLAVAALALGIAALIVYKKNNKPPEPIKKEEKKEDPFPDTPPAPPAPPPDPNPKVDPKPKDKVDPKPKDKVDPKPKEKEPEPKPKEKEPEPKPKDKTPVSTRPSLELAKLRSFALGTPPANPERADKPRVEQLFLDSPFATVKRVFPPFDVTTGDVYALVQTSAPVGGAGEKLSLDTYSASSKARGSRLEVLGDGAANPICDVHSSATGSQFLHAKSGKISVWSLDDSKKLHDAIDPYSTKPEHAKDGLAAAFFSINPNQIVTVTTAGAVHLFDLRTKAIVSEFIPEYAVPNRVSLGTSVTRADNGASVVLAVSGVIYQLRAAPELEVVRKHDLGGEVGQSLAIAASGAPGRLLYAFETDVKGKKDRAVFCLPLGANAKPIVYAWPVVAGTPKSAFWANGTAAGVACDRGVMWFDDDENNFTPLIVTSPPAGLLAFSDDKAFWYVVPHPSKPMQSVLVTLSVPFDGFLDYRRNFGANQPLRALRVDSNGLAK